MTQATLFDQPVKLAIPPLSYGPIASGAGTMQLMLRAGETVNAEPHGEIAVSARTKENSYRLPSGEIVIVTSRKRIDRPPDVDGVLYQAPGGKLTWQSHKAVEQIGIDAASHGWPSLVAERARTWHGKFTFKVERADENGLVAPGKEGLRPPQIGSLHAIGAHWSLSDQPGTIVMPTGTGKTETMLSTLAAYDKGSLLVVVPTDALRSQTARKFLTFGLLRKLGALAKGAGNPLVGVITKRPTKVEDLAILERCNVVITTMAALKNTTGAPSDSEDEDDEDDGGDDTAEVEGFNLYEEIAKRVGVLFVDEAHHIPAASWSKFREAFRGKPVLQFTATPFRRDGRLVDGQVLYNYPLRRAQDDKYFKPITFEPVYEPSPAKADRAVAELAVERLRRDRRDGLNHLMMARCKNITRAKEIHALYAELAPELAPVLIHSKMSNAAALVEDLRAGRNRIAVCVNMLGEGFDLPELKIAAIHDLHKSLAI